MFETLACIFSTLTFLDEFWSEGVKTSPLSISCLFSEMAMMELCLSGGFFGCTYDTLSWCNGWDVWT